MKVVYKYPLAPSGYTPVDTKPDAKVVLVGLDPETRRPAIWVEQVVPDRPKIGTEPMSEAMEVRYFHIVGTGHEIEPNDQHVGSVIDGRYVWHIYERA